MPLSCHPYALLWHTVLHAAALAANASEVVFTRMQYCSYALSALHERYSIVPCHPEVWKPGLGRERRPTSLTFESPPDSVECLLLLIY